jgi:hypothetical protein
LAAGVAAGVVVVVVVVAVDAGAVVEAGAAAEVEVAVDVGMTVRGVVGVDVEDLDADHEAILVDATLAVVETGVVTGGT